MTNTDDVCNYVSTDEVHEDSTSLHSNCSDPVVHLKSDSLETERLPSVAGTFVNTVLTTVPVSVVWSVDLYFPAPLHIGKPRISEYL